MKRRALPETPAARGRPEFAAGPLRGLTSWLAAAAVVLVTALSAAAPALAQPSSGPAQGSLARLRAEARGVARQIQQLDARLEIAVEDYDQARLRLDDCTARLAEARLDLARITTLLVAQEGLLDTQLSEIYKMGDYAVLDALFSAQSLSDMQSRLRFFALLVETDRQTAAHYQALSEQARELTARIDTERTEALHLAQRVDERRQVVAARLAQRQALLAGLNTQIAQELARQRAREQAEAERLARQAGIDLAHITGTAAQLACVREAMRYLGLPYLYGGSLPSTGFDCSGFVMYVFAKFGVNLPHFAAYQADLGIPVPFDLLQPGDLVFFGSPIHHVGMYAGNGLFIHSPHTGDVIKISVLAGYPGLTLACRYPLRLAG
jgi:cell wall-associated NlpC family hydrolase